MKTNTSAFRIKSNRLSSWDYRNSSLYFVTFVTRHKICWFGYIKEEKMFLSNLGQIVERLIRHTQKHYQVVVITHYVVMPNHIHAIIQIKSNTFNDRKPSLGNVIGSMKSAITRKAHECGLKNFAWQSRYFDRIIRDERELENFSSYILANPINWNKDDYYL